MDVRLGREGRNYVDEKIDCTHTKKIQQCQDKEVGFFFFWN